MESGGGAVESPKSSSSSASSREFEFWMAGGNPSSAPSTRLLTADELFSGGVLLPLHLLSLSARRSDHDLAIPPPPSSPPGEDDPVQVESASIMSAPGSGGGGGLSKRWRDIFMKVGEKKVAGETSKEKRKAAAAPEIKINIWPFGRSRSARNGGGSRQRAAAARKASSAPCSRSNSRGDTDDGGVAPARKLAAAVPGRSGVHVGRAVPVCKIKKPAVAVANGGGGMRGLNLSVNSCIGYSGRMSCRGEDGDKVVVAGGEPILAGGGGGNGNGGVFGIKSFFSKKVY